MTINPDPASYSDSKLRRYFKIVKFMMEDSIRQTASKSFNNFVTFVEGFIPKKVEVHSVYMVSNYFSDGTVIEPGPDIHTTHLPLFETDLMRAFD